jgi:hypothetical protein
MLAEKIFLVLATAFFAASAIQAASAGSQHSGKWRLSVSKSKHSAGPGPREMNEAVELDEHHYKVEANGTAADGKPVHIEFDAKFDGKEYPMIGVPWADSVSVRWTDDHEPQMVQRKHGQVTMTITCKVSGDGKTRTCTLKGKDAQGREVDDVAVFDRQ